MTKESQVSGAQIKSFIERVEKLGATKAEITVEIRDVYAEAKGTGFDPKILRKIVALRKKNLESRREEQELLDLYMAAMGMQ